MNTKRPDEKAPAPKPTPLGDALRATVALDIKDPETILKVYQMLGGGK